jgi:hypothetical protein
MLPLLQGSDLQTWTDDNFGETIAGLGLANCAASFYLQVGELELCTARDGPHGSSEATGDGGQQKFFWSPAAFESTKIGRGDLWVMSRSNFR